MNYIALGHCTRTQARVTIYSGTLFTRKKLDGNHGQFETGGTLDSVRVYCVTVCVLVAHVPPASSVKLKAG